MNDSDPKRPGTDADDEINIWLPMAPALRCNCGAQFSRDDHLTLQYFLGVQEKCVRCGDLIDVWKVAVADVAQNAFPALALALVGAHLTLLRLELEAGKIVELDFRKYGLPDDARILGVNYTAEGGAGGGLVPLEIHGNVPKRFTEPVVRHLFPMPVGGQGSGKNHVNIAVTWAPKSEDAPWESLLDAFHRYHVGQHHMCVMPANAAVERVLWNVLARFLEKTVPKERTKQFLQDAATYSFQVNVLLPAFLSLVPGVPPMPSDMRGRLNRLRELRNDVGHGRPIELGRPAAAELLCAAVFAVRYLELVEPLLLKGVAAVAPRR